jgi:hypothetical protein
MGPWDTTGATDGFANRSVERPRPESERGWGPASIE